MGSWVERLGPGTAVHWRGLTEGVTANASLDALTGEVLDHLTVGRRLRAIRGSQSDDRHRQRSPIPDHWVVVLEDFPIGPADLVNDVLDSLLGRTGPEVSFIVVCSGSLALDRHRLRLPGSWRPIGSEDLAMDAVEISEILASHQVEADTSLIDQVHELTQGWAWGVVHAATSMTPGRSVAAALRQTELAIADYLQWSILDRLTEGERDLVTATSVIPDVTPAVAAAVLGDGRQLTSTSIAATCGFIQSHCDGSFSVHPLLRRHLRQLLEHDPEAARTAARRAAESTADRGDLAVALDIAVQAGDWSWAARTMIESLQLPRWLVLGTEHPLDRPDVVDGLGNAEPLLKAVAALGRSWPDAAQLAVRGLDLDLEPRTGSPAEQLSQALVQLSLARWRADPEVGLAQVRRIRALLPNLTVSQRTSTPELVPLLHAHLAAFELWNDEAERARTTLERGARSFRSRRGAEVDEALQVAAADCLGRLAWLEALNGELTRALHHASEVLTARSADSHEIGVVHAQLATAWCHISRTELEQAGQRLETVTVRHSAPADGEVHPEVAAATALTAARLAAVLGEGRVPDDAPPLIQDSAGRRRFEDQLRLIQVLSELDSGRPTTALQLLAEVSRPTADAHALRARAWIQLGDLGSVVVSLRARPAEAPSLVTQVGLDLIQGWVAQARGDRQQLRSTVGRALRVAESEQLRAPIAWAASWLQEVVASDPTLPRTHRVFWHRSAAVCSTIRRPRRCAGCRSSQPPWVP